MKRDRGLRFRRGFTLMEVMVVVFIVGILAAIAIPNYIRTRERSFDREAIAALRLIAAANKHYYGSQEFYYPVGATVTNVSNINYNLSIDLGGTTWNFVVYPTAGGFGANASRAGGARTWMIDDSLSDPVCVGTCL